ncbi:unnamed protein product, partial [Discosporangium mesarthrocarpum]
DEDQPESTQTDGVPLLAEGDRRAQRNRGTKRRTSRVPRLRRRSRLLWKTLCLCMSLGAALSLAWTLVACAEILRHLGRLFLALPLAAHVVADALASLAALLAGEPPPPVLRPTNQVEFQRTLRSGEAVLTANGWEPTR